jgi:HD-GYP domain-containing protein (c-di-GMP phosphodiesterase class II)
MPAMRSYFKWGLRKKIFFTVLAAIALSIGFSTFFSYRRLSHSFMDSTAEKISIVAEKARANVAEKIDNEIDLLKAVALSENIHTAVSNANQLAGDLPHATLAVSIEALDSAWIQGSSSVDELVYDIETNTTSQFLRNLQSVYNEGVEIFVTDENGLNIAMTGRTSDYWQGDEYWWQASFAGNVYCSDPIFDESSQHWAMIISVPVLENGTSGSVLGVVRGTIDITALLNSVFDIGFGETGKGFFVSNDGYVYQKDADDLTISPVSDELATHLTGNKSRLVESIDELGEGTLVITIREVSNAAQLIGYVVVVVQEMEINKMILVNSQENILIAVILMFVLGAISIMTSNGILHGVQTLKSEVSRLAIGDYSRSFSRQIETSKDPDIVSLVDSFTKMKLAVQSREFSLQSSNTELKQAYDATIQGWAKALELRDEETKGHSERVVDLALQLAVKYGFEGKDLTNFRVGALLHDIGKMGIPDSILLKPGPLDSEEWEIMKTHPQLAYQLLCKISFLKDALDIPYAHHERWDGSGYPCGLIGTKIPLAARIFAVLDVWDALTSDRPYRNAWSEAEAKSYLIKNRGVLFDPDVVDSFFELIG